MNPVCTQNEQTSLDIGTFVPFRGFHLGERRLRARGQRRSTVSAPSRRPHGSFRPQRLIPRYAPLLDIASRVPGGLHLTTSVLQPLIKDRVVSTSDSPSIEQLRATRVAISGYPRTGTTFLQTLINLAYGDDSASIKAFGLEVVTDLCDQLLTAGVPGLHFYTMNQSTAVKQICHNLRLGV